MEQYYLKVIENTFCTLRLALIAAICYYLEKDVQLDDEMCMGNEKVTDINPTFNDRGHIVKAETYVTLETNDDDGLCYENKKVLTSLSIEWLIAIYENLSKNKLAR